MQNIKRCLIPDEGNSKSHFLTDLLNMLMEFELAMLLGKKLKNLTLSLNDVTYAKLYTKQYNWTADAMVLYTD